MKHNKELDFFKAVLIGLVILVHIVNFGELHPSVKSSILAFMMPSFLVITGYLVNVNKSLRDFMLYLLKIALPYVMAVMGYAVLSLYLPVRDGIQVLDAPTAIHILFFKPLGPYWFFHVMIVCGTIYYATFRLLRNADTTVKYSIFASLLVVVALFTPFLNIKSAVYYFIGVGVRQYANDFSRIYKKSWWPIFPFGLLISQASFHDWGSISIIICVLSFFCFSAYFFSFLKGKGKSAVEYIGRNTLPIYVFHPIFTMLSKFILPAFSFDATGIAHACFTVAIGIAGSIGIAWLMDWSRLSWLIGRKRILR